MSLGDSVQEYLYNFYMSALRHESNILWITAFTSTAEQPADSINQNIVKGSEERESLSLFSNNISSQKTVMFVFL
jgi:hypothetical protein